MTDEELFNSLRTILVDVFEVPFEDVRREAALYEDLEIDSIDAIDLAGALQKLTGRRLSPEEFKRIRTIDDVLVSVRATAPLPP
ncbi:MAG: acyl carrier protein [Myxococcaceae bacterium]|nr:acyl carrier protein [Myxococcaceae bacterium]